MIMAILIIFLYLYLFYILFRNIAVRELQILIGRGGYGYLMKYLQNLKDDHDLEEHKDEYDTLKKKVEEIIERYPYYKMLFFSFKRLNLESWFTEEEVNLLKEGLSQPKTK